MARYNHKGHDTIRYDITQNIAIRYDPIRSDPINTVAAAGAWILADTAAIVWQPHGTAVWRPHGAGGRTHGSNI